MEKNKIDVPVLKTPREISDLLISITKVNIFEKTRVRNVIEHRAFFCYLLKEKFDFGPSAISVLTLWKLILMLNQMKITNNYLLWKIC